MDVTEIRLSVISGDEKHVAIHISDVQAVADQGLIPPSLVEFCKSALNAHDDGDKVELSKDSEPEFDEAADAAAKAEAEKAAADAAAKAEAEKAAADAAAKA
jgi:hypothetical protein